MVNPQAVSHRRFVGPFVVSMKRLARKLTHWYVAPQIEGLQSQLADLEQCIVDMLKREERFVCQWQTFMCGHNDRASAAAREFQEKVLERCTVSEALLDGITETLAQVEDRINALNKSIDAQENRARTRSALLTKEVARLHERLADLDAERITLRKAMHAQATSDRAA